MHYGNYYNSISTFSKQDSEWKSACQTSSDISVNQGIKERIDSNACKTVFNVRKESFPQVFLLTLIIVRSRDNFGISFRMKQYRRHFSVA